MKYDLTKPRTSLNTGRKPSTNNLKTAVQTLAEMGLNPFYEIARLAVRAEKEKDLVTASTNWRFLSEYVDAKRKAIDPLEQKALAKPRNLSRNTTRCTFNVQREKPAPENAIRYE